MTRNERRQGFKRISIQAEFLTAVFFAAILFPVFGLYGSRDVFAQDAASGQVIENGRFYDDFSRREVEIGDQYRTITVENDRDWDGLSDIEEIELGTNPDDVDTDQDGIGDGDEVNAGLDPLDRSDSPIRSAFSSFSIANFSVPVARDAVGPAVSTLNTVPPAAYLGRTLARPVRVEAHPPTIIAESYFETGDDDWTTFGDAQQFTGVPDYSPLDGNPGGKICATDENLFGVWDWRAPSKFLGNIAFGYSETLTLDITQSGSGTIVDDEDVVLVGGGVKLVHELPDTPGDEWNSYRFTLDELSGWINTETGDNATQQEMLAVLWSLNDLRLRGEYAAGPDQGCLDNVVLYGHDDNDGDGLPLLIEKALGLSGREADTDGDGISDGLEDSDSDGLANALEVLLRTDPSRIDTDENGIPDGDEDPDSDGLSHIEEMQQGTNPFAADSDNDGLSDFEEVQKNTNPLVADTDGDAFGDGGEAGAEIDPLDKLATPARDGITALSTLNAYLPIAPDAIGSTVSVLNEIVPMADAGIGRVFSVQNNAAE